MGSGMYVLYLDECSFKKNSPEEKYYGICGTAIETSELYRIRTSLGELKKNIWENMPYSQAKNQILHATDIRRAKYNKKGESVFKSGEKVRLAFNGVGTIIAENNLKVFGCVINQTSLEDNYQIKTSLYTSDELCLVEIINNFTCFLKHHNAKGKILFESRVSETGSYADSKLKKLFYKIMTRGTRNYKAIDLQSRIDGIEFKKKQENEAGLQLADFIVQPFLFNAAKEKQNKPSVYRVISKQRYSGGKEVGGINSNKYGVVYFK